MVRISLKNTFLSLSFEEEDEEEAHEDKRNGRTGREGDATFRSHSADSAWLCRGLELPEHPADRIPKRGSGRVTQLEHLNRLLEPEAIQQNPESCTAEVDAPETQKATTVSPTPNNDRVCDGPPQAARCRSRRQLRPGLFPLPPGLVERKQPSATPRSFESGEEATSCSDSTGSTMASDLREAGPESPSRQNCRVRRPPWTPPKVNQFPKEYRHVHVPKYLDLEEEYKNTHQDQPPTTLMIRNIPNRYTQRELITELEDLGFAGSFNFLYLPLDKGTMANVGYAFVNFLESRWAERCMVVFQNYCFRRHRRHSRKVAAVSVAHIQGLEANLAHYESAAVNTAKLKQRRPLVVPNISHIVNMDGYGGPWKLPPPR
mmetsp:Transcript_124283/g.247734  ORF Transcript_124283/g.247734 Transcript_124283/m.247734 type:complete len:374 (+) Transcript_124283:56-1177(+)